jgi:hypothetical protein
VQRQVGYVAFHLKILVDLVMARQDGTIGAVDYYDTEEWDFGAKIERIKACLGKHGFLC